MSYVVAIDTYDGANLRVLELVNDTWQAFGTQPDFNYVFGGGTCDSGSIWTDGTNIVVDDYSGQFHHWDGNSWTKKARPGTATKCSTLKSLGNGKLVATSKSGPAYIYNGSSWSILHNASGYYFSDCDGSSENDIYLVGRLNSGYTPKCLHWDGTSWSDITSDVNLTSEGNLRAVRCIRQDLVYIGGGTAGTYAWWNGSTWSNTISDAMVPASWDANSAPADKIAAIDGTSESDLLFAGRGDLWKFPSTWLYTSVTLFAGVHYLPSYYALYSETSVAVISNIEAYFAAANSGGSQACLFHWDNNSNSWVRRSDAVLLAANIQHLSAAPTIGPSVTGQFPADLSQGNSPTTNVSFKVVAGDSSLVLSNIICTINSQTIYDGNSFASGWTNSTVQSSGRDYDFVLIHDTPFTNQSYTVTVNVTDAGGLATNSSWIFFTSTTTSVALGHQMEVGPLLTGSGVINYTIPVASARTETGQEAAPASIGSYSAFTTTAHPNTGNTIQGWKWDERVWSAEPVENMAMALPVNWDASTSGISSNYFQSGIGTDRDLRLSSITQIPSSGINETGIFRTWAPVIDHGYYYDFKDRGYLFSDDSEVLYITYSGITANSSVPASGYNEVTLASRPKIGVPVNALQFKWDNQKGKYITTRDVSKKVAFSGKTDSEGQRLSTYDSNKDEIIWSNIDQSLDEFVIVPSGNVFVVQFNKQYSEQVGSNTVPSGLEVLGYADGTDSQRFHLEYSPIDRTMGVNVYSYIAPSGVATAWETVPMDATISGQQVRLDYDLGVLEFGNNSSLGQLIPIAGETIGVNYYKTLSLEYEPDLTGNTITATETNINPVYRRNSEGFIYLATQLEDPASITLRANLPTIQSNVFGPLFIGNSYTSVVATVKDSKGQLLEGQTVKFFITSNPIAGSFSSLTTVLAPTDLNGEAKAFYSPPANISEIGEEILASGWSIESTPSDPEYSGLAEITRLHTSNLLVEGTSSDIFLYEVHVDDPMLGFMDVTLDQNDSDVQLSGYYDGFFNDQDINGLTRNIEWEEMHRTTWNLSRPVLFTGSAGLGRKKLVSKVDSTALNPHTFTYGAVAPVQPLAVENIGNGEYNIVFDTSSFSIPKPTGSDFPTPSGTLYEYFLVSPTTVKLQASVFNERLNQSILSNEISIKLNVPSYMNGLWILDSINQNHINEISTILASGITASGQKVPLGFRLRSSNVTLAAALNGVTFLDVNRQWNYDPYNPDTVFSGIRLGHQFTVV